MNSDQYFALIQNQLSVYLQSCVGIDDVDMARGQDVCANGITTAYAVVPETEFAQIIASAEQKIRSENDQNATDSGRYNIEREC